MSCHVRGAPRRALPLLLLLPSMLLLATLVIYPTLFTVRNAFYYWNLQTSPRPLMFVGWENFRYVLSSTPFFPALRNTLVIATAGTVVELLLGLGVALLLLTHLPGTRLLRTLLIMPVAVAPIVVGFLFRYMYYEQGGLIPWFLTLLRLPVPPEGLLGSARTALPSVLLADVWQWTPFFALVLYTGLLGISQELVDAARVDGARGGQLVWHIYLPMVWPSAAIVCMIRFMQLFNLFDLVLVLTRGGPGTATYTLAYLLCQEGLVNYNIGTASAMTLIIVALVLLLLNIYARYAFRRWEW